MSLLDLTNDPRRMGILSLGLNLMQAKGNLGQAFGSAGQAALGDMIAAQDRQTQGKEREQAARIRAMQEQALALQLAQTLQEQKRRQGVEDAYKGAMVSPATQALAGGGGPTMQNAQAMQGLLPKLDQGRLLQGLLPVDSQMAAQMLQPKPSDYKVVGGSLVEVGPGGVKEAYRAPEKPNLEALIIQGPDGKPMINPLVMEAKRQLAVAGRAPSAAAAPAAPVAPKLSAAAEKVEIERTKAGQQSQQMMAAIQEARSLLGSKPTESGIGAGVDWLGRQIGVASDSSKKAAQLETLSGWMVANVPRMEGPQSNFDIQNYQTMAAKVGDRSVPVDERLAALQTLEQLHRRYADINGTPLPGGPSFNPKMNTAPSTGPKFLGFE